MSKKGLTSKLLYFTPWRPISRAGQTIASTSKNLQDTFSELRNSLPNHPEGVLYPEGDLRNIPDHKERFEALFELNNWTQEQLDDQIRACTRTKKTSLYCAVVALVSAIYTTFFAQLWMLVFLIPLEGCLIILGVAQAFKFALYETQLLTRTLLSAREFFNRQDFISRLIG